MTVTGMAEDGFIEWRWDVRVIWKDTLLSAKIRSMSSFEKDLGLEACCILCESGICRQLWLEAAKTVVMWGTRQQGIRASKLEHALRL